jgi:hypothetical protein
MKITKETLKKLIKEALGYNSLSIEDRYVKAIRSEGARTVVIELMKVLSEAGVDNKIHEDVLGALEKFNFPDASKHKKLRQQTRSQGGYSGKGAWKSRTPGGDE